MDANKIIMIIMAIGFVLGGIDLLFGKKLGLANRFEEALYFLAAATLSMSGILCLVPMVSNLIKIFLQNVPLFGIDPALVASVMGINMGGHALAIQIAEDPLLGNFSGVIVASMIGAAITFTIPVGISIIEKEDREYFAKGLMIGLIPVPVGCFVSGCIMHIPIKTLLLNEIPVLILAVLLIIGLYFAPDLMTKGFVVLGQGIQKAAIVGLILAGFNYISGTKLIPGVGDLMPAMSIISGMCIVMAGSYCIVEICMKWLHKPLEEIGEKIHINAVAVSGILCSFISLMPVFAMMKDMNKKGKTICTAFFVGGTCVLGGHLSYAAAEAPDYIVAMVVGKLVAAILGAILMHLLYEKMYGENY